MSEVSPLRPGDPSTLGDYVLTGRLGEGGQGTVYLAKGGDGQQVAVKLLHARFATDVPTRDRFMREAAAAKRVARFCTAAVIEIGIENVGDRPYIVSEYVTGTSLHEDVSRNGPRNGADLERLAINTAIALAAIHGAGIVHRDFKPSNVLLGADGARVIDFGVARALDASAPITSHAIGTPAYMAPEQFSDAPLGTAVDMFAWAATMVFAATGRPAFSGNSIPAIINRILTGTPNLGTPEQLGEPLRSLVTSAFAKNPEDRPSAKQVLNTLANLADPSIGQTNELPLEEEAGGESEDRTLSGETEPSAFGTHTSSSDHRDRSRSPRNLLLSIGLIAAILVAAFVIVNKERISDTIQSLYASPPQSGDTGATPNKQPDSPKSPMSVTPLKTLKTPHLFAIAPSAIPRKSITKIEHLRGVLNLEVVDAASVELDGTQTQTLGVDPSTFRSYTPRTTAKSDALWENLANGELLVSFTFSGKTGIAPGETVAGSGRNLRIGASAPISLGSIDALVSRETARTLGIPRGNALVISAPDANINELRNALLKVLPSGSQVATLTPMQP
ncbi:serine/threonine-protein kinase [Microtetraspora malaysiensis]|uniref:serine/threonine-protein kinase n=1 Tax=Microtetraspora malaysiensis TaxID=161358 RepID=UPI0009FCC1CC|nr:serine/threonine-protein kinase [Microtetraspora malaysiensis]